MGTAELSCASLEALARDDRFSVAAVVTQPDKPQGPRTQAATVAGQGSRAGNCVCPCSSRRAPATKNSSPNLRALKPDLIVVVAYGHILPPAILDLPRHGCLNVHTSLLPKYRGAAPIQWAIANGETETGVTIMKMDAGLDTGPMVSQCRTPIHPAEDSATLHDRLARLGAELLVRTIPDYVAGKIQPQSQPADGATYAPKIKKEDGRIDWKLPAKTIMEPVARLHAVAGRVYLLVRRRAFGWSSHAGRRIPGERNGACAQIALAENLEGGNGHPKRRTRNHFIGG